MGNADQFGKRQIESRKRIRLANRQMHGEGGRGNQETIEAGRSDGDFSVQE
jgi:hypothetical protein